MESDQPLHVSTDDARIARWHARAAFVFLAILLLVSFLANLLLPRTDLAFHSGRFEWLSHFRLKIAERHLLYYGFLTHTYLAIFHAVVPTLAGRPIPWPVISRALSWLWAVIPVLAVVWSMMGMGTHGTWLEPPLFMVPVVLILLSTKSCQFLFAIIGTDAWRHAATPYFVLAILGAPIVATTLAATIAWRSPDRERDFELELEPKTEPTEQQGALLALGTLAPVGLGLAIWAAAIRGAPTRAFELGSRISLGYLLFSIGLRTVGASFAPPLLGDHLIGLPSEIALWGAFLSVVVTYLHAHVATRRKYRPANSSWWLEWSGAWFVIVGVAALWIRFRYGAEMPLGRRYFASALAGLALLACPFGCLLYMADWLSASTTKPGRDHPRWRRLAIAILISGVLATAFGWRLPTF